jgi:hypothetical protein
MVAIGTDLTFGNGYYDTTTTTTLDSFVSYATDVSDNVESSYSSTVSRITLLQYTPAQAALSAISAVAPTSAEISYLLNTGWDTHARSINKISKGAYLEYTLNSGVYGMFLGIGVAEKDGDSLSSFEHGLLVDSTGIWAYENGVKVKQIKTNHILASKIRVFRQSDKRIVYMVVTADESLIYVSSDYPQTTTLYCYGYLYSSADTVNSAALKTGSVQFGSA